MELLITRLDRQLRSLDREATLAAQGGKTSITHQSSLLAEYIKLTTTEGIIPAIQYIVLDGLARNFALYQDDRERSKILSAMAEELASSSESEILVSIQIVQYTYPSLYQNARELIDLSQKRALEHLTKMPIAELNTSNTYNANKIEKENIYDRKSSSVLMANQFDDDLDDLTFPEVKPKSLNLVNRINSLNSKTKAQKFYIVTKTIFKWLIIIIGFLLKWSAIICVGIFGFVLACIGNMLS